LNDLLSPWPVTIFRRVDAGYYILAADSIHFSATKFIGFKVSDLTLEKRP